MDKKANVASRAIIMIFVLLFSMILLQMSVSAAGSYTVTADTGVNGVLGRTKTVNIKVTNDGGSSLYNIGFDLLLDNGLEVDTEGCSIAPATTAYQAGTPLSKQKVTWNSLIDLAPGEEYCFSIPVKILVNHKNLDGTDIVGNSVNIGDVLNGSIDVNAGDIPQSTNDYSVNSTFDLTVVPFEVQFSCPEKKLKGAGSTTEAGDDYTPAIYQYTINLTNNTVHSSIIDLDTIVGNGIQPVNFSYAPASSSMQPDGTTAVLWSGYNLNAGDSDTITFDAAIFNKTTLDGVVNSGIVIADETPIDTALTYSGSMQGDSVSYTDTLTATIKAKELTIAGTVTPNTGIGHGTAIKYTLKVTTNQYYGANNVVITDTLKDGIDFVSENNNSNFSNTPQGNGDSSLVWTPAYASIAAATAQFIEVNATVKSTWKDGSAIVANDTIVNPITVSGACSFETYNSNPQDASSIAFSIDTPLVLNELLTVNGGAPIMINGIPNVAIGDVLEYRLTYDASAINAKQKDVSITDFFPVGTGYASSAPNPLMYYENGAPVGGWSDMDNAPSIDETNPNNSFFNADFSYVDVNKKYEAVIKLIVKDVPEIVNGRQVYNKLRAQFFNTAGTVKLLEDEEKLQYSAPELGITKTASKSTNILGGETISFTVVISNTGEATAYGVEVKDALPAEYANRTNAALPAGVTFNTNVYSITSISKGQSVVLTYTTDVINPIGAGRDLSNSATIEKYKKANGGIDYSDNPKQQATVTMSAASAAITLSIVDNSRNDLAAAALSKGDWVVYHITATLPQNVTAYNSNIVDTLTESQTVAPNCVFSAYDAATNVGVDNAYTNNNNASGNKITLNIGTINGSTTGSTTVDYYIKATINNYTTPQHNNGAGITWYDQLAGGTSHNITSNSLAYSVKAPDLDASLDMSPATLIMVNGDTPSFRLRIKNTKATTNTAYNFAPYITVPSYVTLSNFQHVDKGTWNGNPQDLVAVTSTPIAGMTQYTIPQISQLLAADEYHIVFKASFTGERPSGDSFNITGYTGAWYTTPENVIPLPTDLTGLAINIPSATITNTILTSDNGGSTTEIRPYDTVTYNINVKIPKGTMVYQPRLNETFPADFMLVELEDQNAVAHGGDTITWPYTIDNNSVAAVGADINYTFKLKFLAKPNGVFGGVNRYTAADTATLLWNIANGSNQKTASAPLVNIDVVKPSMSITAYSSDKTVFNTQGETIIFNGSIRNSGQSTANNVKLVATIPDGMVIDVPSITAGGVKTDLNHIQWDFASIAKATTQNISFRLNEDGNLATPSSGNVQLSIDEYFSTPDSMNSKKYNSVSQIITVSQPLVTVDSVTVTPATATVQKGNTQDFNATVSGANNPAQTVNWSVAGGVAGTSIDNFGLLAIAADETASNLIVTATSTVDNTKSGTADVAVINIPSPAPTVDNVTVTPATATVQKGSIQTFSAAVTGTNNPEQTVTWAVYGNTSGSTIIDNVGLLTIDADEAANYITVSATSTVDNTKSGTASVTVTDVPPPAPTVDSVTVTPAMATVQKGSKQTFSAAVTGTNNPEQTVTWAVYGNTSGSTIIDNVGQLTIAMDETANNLTVTASSTEDNAKYGTASVTVVEKTYPLYITAGTGGSITTGSSGDYTAGTVISITATASSNYNFRQWTSTGGGSFGSTTSADTTFTMPASAVSITANFTYNSSFDDGGGSSINTNTSVSAPVYTADVSSNGTTGYTLPIVLNANLDSVAVDVGTQQGNIVTGGENVVITVQAIPGVVDYTMNIPVEYLSESSGKGTLTFNTNTGSIIIPANMLAGITGEEGKKAEITIGQCDKSSLPEAAKAIIGDRPLIRLAMSINGKQIEWNNPNSQVTISIPYNPTAAELVNLESIIVWYIDSSGNVVSVPNGHYNPDTGTVTFITTHFSYYAVGYNKVNFKDIPKSTWYSNAVSFIAARGIANGTGNGSYNPEAKLTRGEFMVMLMRAYGITPKANHSDNFSDSGSTYYTGYLAAAKQLAISSGIGNNNFAPDKEITRQEMFTLLYNVLKAAGKLPVGTSGKQLSDFSDAGQIAAWAKDAMKLMTETGIVSGNGSKLSPASTATRAEMAQILYKLMSNSI